jgi:hypothetical protein
MLLNTRHRGKQPQKVRQAVSDLPDAVQSAIGAESLAAAVLCLLLLLLPFSSLVFLLRLLLLSLVVAQLVSITISVEAALAFHTDLSDSFPRLQFLSLFLSFVFFNSFPLCAASLPICCTSRSFFAVVVLLVS